MRYFGDTLRLSQKYCYRLQRLHLAHLLYTIFGIFYKVMTLSPLKPFKEFIHFGIKSLPLYCLRCLHCCLQCSGYASSRVLLKSGRPQTATGSDHGHQGEDVSRHNTGRYKHTPALLWLDIMDADCGAQSGHSRLLVRVHRGADTWSPPAAAKAGQDLLWSTFFGGAAPAAQSSPTKLPSYLTKYLPTQRPCWPFYTVRSP